MGNESGYRPSDGSPLALGGSAEVTEPGASARVDKRPVTTVRRVRKGDPIPLPVWEEDGALTGYRTKPAECDGYYIECGSVCVFVARKAIYWRK